MSLMEQEKNCQILGRKLSALVGIRIDRQGTCQQVVVICASGFGEWSQAQCAGTSVRCLRLWEDDAQLTAYDYYLCGKLYSKTCSNIWSWYVRILALCRLGPCAKFKFHTLQTKERWVEVFGNGPGAGPAGKTHGVVTDANRPASLRT